MRLNNKGYSLIELIAVISILAIMVGGASYGLSLMYSRDAETVARQIDEGLTEARMAAMSRAGTFAVQVDSDASTGLIQNITVVQDGSTEFKKIVVSKEATVVLSDGASLTLSDFEIQFDKSNGSVLKVGDIGAADPATEKLYTIEVSAKNKTSIINLVSITGRHYIEK